MDGKPIRRVLEWLLNRDLTDADMAAALDVHPSNYSRHKDDDDYPSFEELTTLGAYFHVSPKMLQIAFGLLDKLRSASARGRRGNLAVVRTMTEKGGG